MGKGNKAPKGPDWEKMVKKVSGFVDQNQDLFKEALNFGKDQFAGGAEFVKQLQDFGMEAGGRLADSASAYQKDVDDRVSQLDDLGKQFGDTATSEFEKSLANAEKITGELMPGFESSAQTGGALIDRYTSQGIPFQDEYINKLKTWDTTDRREDRAAQAVSDINMTTEAARESELRRLESYGIDPSQTRSAALDARIQAQNAIAKAQAANAGRRAVESEGLTLGKTASDMYDQSLAAGRGMVESAGQQGANISEILRKPGQDYLGSLQALGEYGINVGSMEQAGGLNAFNMNQAAENFRQAGITGAASYYDANRRYGSGIYEQGSKMLQGSADMLSSANNSATGSHQAAIQAYDSEQKNSFWGGLGQLAGMAIPAALGSPWLGGAIGSMTGKWSEGGPVPKEMSPSRGAIPDDVPAYLDADEYVLDRDTVRWHGIKNLSKLQKEAREGLAIPDDTAGSGRNPRAPALPRGGASTGTSMTR